MKITTTFCRSGFKKVMNRSKDIWHQRSIATPAGQEELVDLQGDVSSLFVKNSSESGDVKITMLDDTLEVYSCTKKPGNGVVVPAENLSLGSAGYVIDRVKIENIGSTESTVEITTI